jgi:CRP-like cAMP-binding protein
MTSYRNHLLRSFRAADLALLHTSLEPVRLKRGECLFEVGQEAQFVYFLEAGMVSLVLRVSGHEVETSVVGREGMVGMPILLGQSRTITEAVVHLEGEGWRMPASILEQAFKGGGPLQERLLSYISAVLAQNTQLAMCSHVHTPQERLARWLLMTADRAGDAAGGAETESALKFDLAPEFLAQMVGTDAGNAAAQIGVMQRAGLLAFSGNRFEICSRQDMEDASCDCYFHIREAFARLTAEAPTDISR